MIHILSVLPPCLSQDIVFPSNKKPVIPIVLISTFSYPPTDCNKLSPIVLMRDFFCN